MCSKWVGSKCRKEIYEYTGMRTCTWVNMHVYVCKCAHVSQGQDKVRVQGKLYCIQMFCCWHISQAAFWKCPSGDYRICLLFKFTVRQEVSINSAKRPVVCCLFLETDISVFPHPQGTALELRFEESVGIVKSVDIKGFPRVHIITLVQKSVVTSWAELYKIE